ncbi:MAG: zinc ribbon domain-containing protein [Microcoleaceae cyanobacterium]
MPIYDYFCPENNQTLEVMHPISRKVKTWGQLCQLANQDLGETPETATVRRLLSAPNLAIPTSDREYRDAGFTRLVKRDQGVYENVTHNE